MVFGVFRHEIQVPPFNQYMATEQAMTPEQQKFYRIWLKHWDRGDPLDVRGNISYLLCYTYCALALAPAKAAHELSRLAEAYAAETKFLGYCRAWLSDCYVLTGQYRRALENYPPIPISTRGSTCTDHILSLKLHIGERIAGRDILTLNGPRVTKWGKGHLEQVARYLVPAHDCR